VREDDGAGKLNGFTLQRIIFGRARTAMMREPPSATLSARRPPLARFLLIPW
jgi:hypothetical protein